MIALSIPETLFLVDPRPRQSAACMQGAMLGLLGSGAVTLEVETTGQLRVLIGPPTTLSAPLTAVDAALRERGSTTLSGTDVLYRLQQAFGSDYGRYVDAVLGPVLQGRGLLGVHQRRRWWGGKTRSWSRTPAGESVVQPLQRRIDALASLPDLMKRAPAEAVDLARAAGPLLLASASGRAALPRLRELAAKWVPAAVLAETLARSRADLEDVVEVGEFLLDLDWTELTAMLTDTTALLSAAQVETGGDGGSGGDGGGGGGD